jgi:hypothetical protein
MIEPSMLDVATIETLPDAGAAPVDTVPPEVQPHWTIATRSDWIQERPFHR